MLLKKITGSVGSVMTGYLDEMPGQCQAVHMFFGELQPFISLADRTLLHLSPIFTGTIHLMSSMVFSIQTDYFGRCVCVSDNPHIHEI